jgi:hypothetical protein
MIIVLLRVKINQFFFTILSKLNQFKNRWVRLYTTPGGCCSSKTITHVFTASGTFRDSKHLRGDRRILQRLRPRSPAACKEMQDKIESNLTLLCFHYRHGADTGIA